MSDTNHFELLDKPPLNRYDFTGLVNMWEKLVMEIIADMLDKHEICPCRDCVLDTAALALNTLPASYWVLGSYDVFSPPEKFIDDTDNYRLAQEAVLSAYRLVQANPHH